MNDKLIRWVCRKCKSDKFNFKGKKALVTCAECNTLHELKPDGRLYICIIGGKK